MVITSSKALLTMYILSKLRLLARTPLPTVRQVSTQGRNITTEYERSIRLRLPHIAIRQTPLLLLVFPSHHQDLRLPPFCQARSLSPGLTTLTMKPVSRRSESKVLQAHIQPLQQREQMQQLTAISV